MVRVTLAVNPPGHWGAHRVADPAADRGLGGAGGDDHTRRRERRRRGGEDAQRRPAPSVEHGVLPGSMRWAARVVACGHRCPGDVVGPWMHRVVRQALSYGSTDPVRCKTVGSPVAWPGLAGGPGSLDTANCFEPGTVGVGSPDPLPHPCAAFRRTIMRLARPVAACPAIVLAAGLLVGIPQPAAGAAAEPVTVTVNTRAGLATMPDTGLGVNHAIWDSEPGHHRDVGPAARGRGADDALPRRLVRRHLPLEGPHRARRLRRARTPTSTPSWRRSGGSAPSR